MYLQCSARRDNSTYASVNLRLDDYLGNNDGQYPLLWVEKSPRSRFSNFGAGKFEWYSKKTSQFEDSGRNFSKSAENVTWALEEDDSVFVLGAQLKNEEGKAKDAKMVLSGRFENFDGTLIFIDESGQPFLGEREG